MLTNLALHLSKSVHVTECKGSLVFIKRVSFFVFFSILVRAARRIKRQNANKAQPGSWAAERDPPECRMFVGS